MVSRIRVRTAVVLGAIGLAPLAAGCGGGSGASAAALATTTTGTTTTAPGGGGPNSAAFQAYRSCLSAHGVTFPGRPGGGQGGTRPAGQPPSTTGTPPAGAGPQDRFGQLTAKQRQALTACQSKRPTGARGFGGGNARGGPANGALAKYTACLKSHGVTFGSTSTSSSAFAKATAACKSLLPASTGGSAHGGTTTTTP